LEAACTLIATLLAQECATLAGDGVVHDTASAASSNLLGLVFSLVALDENDDRKKW
jgi:hypothetical protein